MTKTPNIFPLTFTHSFIILHPQTCVFTHLNTYKDTHTYIHVLKELLIITSELFLFWVDSQPFLSESMLGALEEKVKALADTSENE